MKTDGGNRKQLITVLVIIVHLLLTIISRFIRKPLNFFKLIHFGYVAYLVFIIDHILSFKFNKKYLKYLFLLTFLFSILN